MPTQPTHDFAHAEVPKIVETLSAGRVAVEVWANRVSACLEGNASAASRQRPTKHAVQPFRQHNLAAQSSSGVELLIHPATI